MSLTQATPTVTKNEALDVTLKEPSTLAYALNNTVLLSDSVGKPLVFAYSPTLDLFVRLRADHGASNIISTSRDLITWTEINVSGNTSSFKTIDWYDGINKFIGFGSGKKIESTNGVTWTVSDTTSTPTAPIFSTSSYIARNSNASLMINANNTTASLSYSTNQGTTWTSIAFNNNSDYPYNYAFDGLYPITCNSTGTSGTFVIGSFQTLILEGGHIRSSTDGINWPIRRSGDRVGFGNINRIIWCEGPGIFIADQFNTSINDISYTYSYDGITWIDVPWSNLGFSVIPIVYNSYFKIIIAKTVGNAVAGEYPLIYSSDGINWRPLCTDRRTSSNEFSRWVFNNRYPFRGVIANSVAGSWLRTLEVSGNFQ